MKGRLWKRYLDGVKKIETFSSNNWLGRYMSIEASAINLVANQIEEHYKNSSDVSEWESYSYIEDRDWDYELKAMEEDVMVDISNITFKEGGDAWWNQRVKLLEWKYYERGSGSMKGIKC